MEIAALLAEYLRTPVSSRGELVASNPSLFAPDVVEALDDAYDLLAQVRKQARDACRSIDDVMENLDLPSLPRLTPTERSELVFTEEVMIAQFVDELLLLLSQRETTFCSLKERLSASDEVCNFAKPWHQQRSVVLEILSFLPVECTFNVAENVCRLWQTWLCVPADSRAFWTGCVQREFPENMQTLIQLQEVDLYESDWRTIAMICCTDEEKDDLMVEGEVTAL
ncbi:hypothetical protein MOQ_002490 [Trypanosoma cruzi marinkellei]|uniref:F-box domain-containing protein n=1 Tax=Trypanosoma cruzi marinkellei TaxID=85056 RepID=K2N2A3_TRYCR|nr:hypothetical protein MOQ_002490 [Trypanosoma cruzi marinkellei]